MLKQMEFAYETSQLTYGANHVTGWIRLLLSAPKMMPYKWFAYKRNTTLKSAVKRINIFLRKSLISFSVLTFSL